MNILFEIQLLSLFEVELGLDEAQDAIQKSVSLESISLQLPCSLATEVERVP